MKGSSILYAFIGGAIVGGAIGLIFAPEKGEDLRYRMKHMLKKKGEDYSDDDLEELVEQLTAEIEE